MTTPADFHHGLLARLIIIDETGMTWRYDLDFEVQTDVPLRLLPPQSQPPSTDGALFAAFQEQLGLKLESTKGLFDVLVIDHERPTLNQSSSW